MKILFLTFLFLFSKTLLIYAEDKFLSPVKGITNTITSIMPFDLLEKAGKKITSFGTKELLFGMTAATIISEGLSNNENTAIKNESKSQQLQRVRAKGHINLNGIDENEAKRRALEDALYFASMKAGASVQGFSVIDEETNLNESFIVEPNNRILDYKIINSYKKDENYIVEVEAIIGFINNENNTCIKRKILNIKEFKGDQIINSSTPSWANNYINNILYNIRKSMKNNISFNYNNYSKKTFDFNEGGFDKSYDYLTLVNGTYDLSHGDYIYIPSFIIKKSKNYPGFYKGIKEGLDRTFFDSDAISIYSKIDIFDAIKNTLVFTIEKEYFIPINIDSNFETVELYTKRDKEKLNDELNNISLDIFSNLKEKLSCVPILVEVKLINDRLEVPVGSMQGLRKNQLAVLNENEENNLTMLSISEIRSNRAILEPLNSKIKLEDLSGKQTRFLE